MTRNTRSIGIVISVLGLILLLILGFVKSNVDTQEKYLCEITHADPNLDIQACPAHNSNNSWYLLFAFGVSFVALGLGLYLIIADRNKGASETSSSTSREHQDENDRPGPVSEKSSTGSNTRTPDLSKLDDTEKKVCEIIKASEGSCYQSDIIKATEFSKVKITRILDKLEQKKIIERKRRGMANLVILR